MTLTRSAAERTKDGATSAAPRHCWREGKENWVIFGEVVGIHVDPKIIRDGLVDVTIYKPVSRLGYMDYSTTIDVFQMDRPD